MTISAAVCCFLTYQLQVVRVIIVFFTTKFKNVSGISSFLFKLFTELYTRNSSSPVEPRLRYKPRKSRQQHHPPELNCLAAAVPTSPRGGRIYSPLCRHYTSSSKCGCWRGRKLYSQLVGRSESEKQHSSGVCSKRGDPSHREPHTILLSYYI